MGTDSLARTRRGLAWVLVLVTHLAACSGNPSLVPARLPSSPTPSASPTANATPSATPKSTPTPSPTASATAAPVAGTIPESGTVVLPTGVKLSPSALHVQNSVAFTTPNASGAFTLAELSGGTQFTVVTDANGNFVLGGFFGPGETTIDALSTAKLLAFYGGALYSLPSPYRGQMVDAIATAPGFSTLENAVTAALAVNPAGLAGNPTVTAAVTAFITSLYATSNTSSAARMLRAAERHRFDAAVSPSTVSGVTTINDFPNGVHFVNAYRRAAEAFIDQDSYVNAAGTRVPAPVADIHAPVMLSPTSGLSNVTGSLIGAIQGYFSGKTAYTPVSSNDVPLANLSMAKSTRYLITIVGAGAPNPAIPLRAEELTARQNLGLTQLVQDFIIPLVTSIVIPLQSSAIDEALAFDGGNAAVVDLIDALAAVPNLAAEASSASTTEQAYYDALSAIAGSNTLKALVYQSIQNLAQGKYGFLSAQTFFTEASAFLNKVNVIGGALVATDIAVVVENVAASNGADQVRVDVTTDQVSLTPATQKLDAGKSTMLTANVFNADAGDAFAYTYTNTAKFGHLSDGLPGHVDNFTSSHGTVTYVANAGAAGTDAIGVSIALIQNSQRLPVGSSVASVTVIPAPVSISLSPSGCHDFGVSGGSLTYTATATGVPAGLTPYYAWAFGSSGPNPPTAGVTFTDPGSTINTLYDARVGPSSVVSVDIAPDTTGGVANESLQVQLLEVDSSGTIVGPSGVFVAAHSYLSWGLLSCASSTAMRTFRSL